MTLYFGLFRMWLSKCTRAYKNINQLNVFIVFLHIFITETSKCPMYKFYRIASNSLQAIQIVHEIFDCPSYVNSFNIVFSVTSHYSFAHAKTNKMTCAPSDDSDQPGHPLSLIRVLASAHWVDKDPMLLRANSKDSDQTGADAQEQT